MDIAPLPASPRTRWILLPLLAASVVAISPEDVRAGPSGTKPGVPPGVGWAKSIPKLGGKKMGKGAIEKLLPAGFTYVDHWGCPDGSNKCLGLWVVNPKGKPLTYLLSSQTCAKAKGKSPDSSSVQATHKCFAGYRALHRIKMNDGLVVDGDEFALKWSHGVQQVVDGRWRTIGTIEAGYVRVDAGSAGWTEYTHYTFRNADGTIAQTESTETQTVPSGGGAQGSIDARCQAMADSRRSASNTMWAAIDLVCDAVVPDNWSVQGQFSPAGVGGTLGLQHDFQLCENTEKLGGAIADGTRNALVSDCLANPSHFFPGDYPSKPPSLEAIAGFMDRISEPKISPNLCLDYTFNLDLTWVKDGIQYDCNGDVLMECQEEASGACKCAATEVDNLACSES